MENPTSRVQPRWWKITWYLLTHPEILFWTIITIASTGIYLYFSYAVIMFDVISKEMTNQLYTSVLSAIGTTILMSAISGVRILYRHYYLKQSSVFELSLEEQRIMLFVLCNLGLFVTTQIIAVSWMA